ncbi:MAG TPA: hypothetical protein VEM76_07820 [Anaeromyxobacteraceae bacterium]|nr:hypothetical protein [Anaeromyxobacteraceae bacterium]
MSAIRVLLVGALLIAGRAPARADDVTREETWPSDVGLQVGVDVPAGAVLAVTLRPGLPWARLHGGLTWNYFAFGLQGGATVALVRAGVTPTATLEGGAVFDADLRSPFSGLSIPTALRPSLSSAGYSYVSGLIGLELGNPAGHAFFLRAGLTRVWSTLAGVDSATLTTTPLHLAAWAPAVSAGVALRFW